jgi:hypothetical protein
LHVARAYDFDFAPALVTLSTAYAEAGRFEEAVDTAEEGLKLADAAYDHRLAAILRERLKLFREGKPFHLTEDTR